MDIFKLPIFAESWNVAYRRKTCDLLYENLQSPFYVIRNSFRFWAADPFVFEYKGEAYIFAELYDYIKRRGTIGYYKISAGGKKWIPVISEPYHLSFPYVFCVDNQIFIMPESSQCGLLYMYRATSFPDKWEKCEFLRSKIKYVDTTPFCAYGKRLALTYDLCSRNLWLLDFVDGHDRIADFSSPEYKRPAGFFDYYNGIRAAQNCEVDYGKGLIFYRFKLGEDLSYQENEIFRVFPEDLSFSKKLYLDGLHTYNASKNFEVVDIKTRRINPIDLFGRIVSKIWKRFGLNRKKQKQRDLTDDMLD